MNDFIFDIQRFADEDTTDDTSTDDTSTDDTTTDDTTTDDTTTDDTSTDDSSTTTRTDMTISAGGTYTVESAGTITIATSDPVTLVGTEGSSPLDAQILTGTTAANLTVNNLNLSSTGSPIKFGSGGGTLTLLGNNTLTTSGTNSAALNIGGGLTINGTGYLTATSTGYGAGVGTDYGEATSANLTVEGGNVTAASNYGAGVGSGFQSTIGTIAITGGVVNATATSGAGVGTGAGTGGLANAGTITITGGIVSGTGQDGAGVGSGFGGAVGNITIGGTATVTAISTGNGAGLGSGSTFGATASAGNIAINGAAYVVATSTAYGAGIGSGYARYSGTNSAGSIAIGGDATVTATSISNGVGIGAGAADSSATNTVGAISLSGDAATTAKSMVVVDNGNTAQQTTINGTAVSGARLVYVDGIYSNSVSASAAGSGSSESNVTQVVYGEDVTGVTNVGKVDGSDDYVYVGGLGVISDYAGTTIGTDGESGAKIRYATDFWGFSFDGDTLSMNSSTGTLIIQNCKDKLITIADAAGNTTAYVYSPNMGGVIYGNLFSPLEVVAGSATGSDVIYAGSGGSTMWGGFGAYDDTLTGGIGHDEYVYVDGGGRDIITNYGTEDLIKINGTLNGVNMFGTFALNFSDGSLTVADYADKIITVANGAGAVLGQAFYASGPGTVDGRGLAGTEILVGGAFGSNLIIAGDGGSHMWANFGGVNTLVGGAGCDEFIYTAGSGLVAVQNADVFDTVNLFGMTLDQIASVNVTATSTTIGFNDGGALNVQGSGVTYKIDGANYYADTRTGTLVQA